jgi:autotransporter-associated beta strand protein
MRRSRMMAIVCLMGIGLGVHISRVEAAVRTWVGPAGGNWSDQNNWSPAGPLVASDDLEFTGAPTTSNNDLPGLQITRLSFTGTHTIGGNGVSLRDLALGGTTGDTTVDLPLTLLGNQDWYIGQPQLHMNGTVDLNGFQLGIENYSSSMFRVITGDGDIRKFGSGYLLFDSANDFTGKVYIQAGMLAIANARSLGTADGTMATGTVVSSGASLQINYVAALDEPLQLSGLGHAGSGAVFIYEDDDPFVFTGPVELTHPINTSVVAITTGPPPRVTFSQPLTGYGLLILSDTTVVLAATGNTFTRARFAKGDFAATPNGTLRLGVDDAVAPEFTVEIPSTANFDLAGHSVSVAAVSGLGKVKLGTGGGILRVVSADATHTELGGTISGIGTLYKQGSGSLALAGANTFTGAVQVSTGELWVLHPNALGVADGTPENGTTVTAGATLGVGAASLANEVLTIAGTGHSFGALQIGAFGPVSIAGPVTVAGDALIGISFGAHVTLAGGVGGTGQLRLAGTAGEVRLTGQGSTFTGGSIFVDGVILHIDANGVLDPAASILNEGLIELGGHVLEIANLLGNGNVSLGTGGALRIGYGGSYGGGITGTGTLTKLGDGAFSLTGGTTFTGPVTVSRGALILEHAQALSSPITVLDGAALHFATTTTYSQPVSLAGGGVGGSGGALRVSNNAQVTLMGATTMTADARMAIDAASELRLQGLVTAPVLRFTGPGGTLSLGSSSNVIGAVQFSAATLQLNASQALPSSIALAVPTASTFNLNGFTQTLAGISGLGTVAIGGGSLMLSATNTGSVFDGVLAGTGTLLLNGIGLTLTGGAHTFSGSILAIGGSLSHRGTLPAKIQGGAPTSHPDPAASSARSR